MTALLDSATVEAGHAWDALRIPEPWGGTLYDVLAAHEGDRVRLGGVILSTRSGCTYWLIPTGSAPEQWPDGCRLLTRGSWVTLPARGINRASAHWLHHPHPQQLTGAVWLAAALDTTRRAA
jgi:hypothetical protein